MHWQQKERQGKSPFFIEHKVGNIVTKDVKKSGIFNAFFASVLDSKTGYPQASCPPGLADRNREQNRLPTVQEEAGSDLLWLPDSPRSMELNGIWPRSRGSWQKSFPRWSLSLIICPGQPRSSQMAGAWPVWHPSTKRPGRRICRARVSILIFRIIEWCRLRMTSKDCLVKPFVGKET